MGLITTPSGPLATPREAKRISAFGPPEGDGAAGWPGVGAGADAPWGGPPGGPGPTPPLAAAAAPVPVLWSEAHPAVAIVRASATLPRPRARARRDRALVMLPPPLMALWARPARPHSDDGR